MSFETSESFARETDRRDPLASFRGRFHRPRGRIYLDGNSLGLASREAVAELSRTLREWQTLGIGGWLEADPPWFTLGETLGALAAPLVGASSEEVVCSGTTTVDLHALVATFYRPEGRRRRILADCLNFPSDLYALAGQLKLRGLAAEHLLVLAESRDARTLDEAQLIARMDEEVALVLLPSVLYRSGQLLDLERLSRAARERDILIGLDCSHSVGAVPHRFDAWGVDFAFWCGYKYLNGGPGSPAFLYVNRRHFGAEPLLAGWWGYIKERQFAMDPEFRHEPSAAGWQISTPAVLSAAPLLGALRVIHDAGIERIRARSLELTGYLMFLVDNLLPQERTCLSIGTPREPGRRGGHVALEGPGWMWQVHQAIKARGIVPDYRPPGVIRLAPTALYTSFHEVWRTVRTIKTVLDRGEYRRYPLERTAVT